MSTDPQQQELGLREVNPITRVEEYKFEPIQGYPMLQWAGKRPFTSTQYYPAQQKETYGPEVNGWRNKIYWGDNLQVMSHLLREYRGKIKLVYIDPPFDSKADYKKTIQIKGKIATSDQAVFEEKQYTDIWTNDEYLQFMYERLILIKELLLDDGSVYVHLDWRVGHYVKVILDEVFGSGNFHNDIRWIRSLPHNDPNQYGRFSDMILYYSLSEKRLFNPQYIPQKEDSVEAHYKTDSNGRKFRLASLLAPGGRGPRYPYKGYDKSWRFTQEKMLALEAEGRIYHKEGQMPSRIYYLDESLGSQVQDVWTDISPLNPMATERTGYPTQKPEALLERIINASSNPNDIIFDCFMGSGTTQAVAMKLGRRFIGADINLGAVQITTKRLLNVASELRSQSQKLIPEEGQPETHYTGFEVYNVNNYDIFRNPVEAKDLLKNALEVNALPLGSLFDGEKDGRMVKIMSINRIATRHDLTELINGFDYQTFQKRYNEHPNQPVEKVTLVCMGHESDLAAYLQKEMTPMKLDVEVVDILRDRQDLHFKRDSEAHIIIKDGELVIEQFYPLNLLGKLSEQKEDVEEWRELVDSIMVDWNYDGAVLQPTIIDVPEGNALVAGHYKVPKDAGTIRVKITDLLSESLEVEIAHA
ncbi:MAG TPA: site-specific DNA-methyltransferase [Ktedonobacteraceae bacterium]|nr:site-specific DNA-methyltransferase [Ktedonobacteraceae bacterium]